MQKAVVIVLAILMTITLTLTTDKKAEAFDVTLVIGALYPAVMVIGGLILFRNHPECRKTDTLGELGECAQMDETSDRGIVEVPTEVK